MKWTVTENKEFLRLYDYTQEEWDQVQHSFRKRIRGWFYNPMVKKKIWDGYVPFFKNGFIPIGLWNEVFKLGEKFGYDVQIDNLGLIVDENFEKQRFLEWADSHFKDHPKIKPREFQLESAAEILKYRVSSSEIATSSGKTLIAFLVYGYLLHTGNLRRMLVIVPNTTLVMQLKDDWEDYNMEKLSMRIRQVYGGSRDNDPSANIVVGTFQSLVRKPLGYFKGIDAVFCDEAHQAKTSSIKTVFSKCKESVYRFGMSGTLQEDGSADFFTITAILGPMINRISPKFLFAKGFATPVKVRIIKVTYDNPKLCENLYTIRKNKGELDGSKILAMEKKIAITSKERFNLVIDIISKTTKNTMVLFSNIKDKFGKNLYDAIRERTNKTAYYIDGGVAQDHRSYFKAEMEEGNDKVIVASFTTFSTGISIKNVHNIILVESYKSEIIIKQTMGRGMRLLEGKDSFTVIDIVDDMSYPGSKRLSDNYLLKHGKSRLEYYKHYTTDIKVLSKKISR